MSNYPEHSCELANEAGNPVEPLVVTCGNCGRGWCERCDPAPAALCHWCNGRGYSIAPVPPRQVRAIWGTR